MRVLSWTHIPIAIAIEEKFCGKQKNSLATFPMLHMILQREGNIPNDYARRSTLEHNLLVTTKKYSKWEKKRGISIKEIIREVYIKRNLRPLSNVEFFFFFLKGPTHANRATNPGMIRCVLDDSLKRSPKTKKESRCVCIYFASERNLLL